MSLIGMAEESYLRREIKRLKTIEVLIRRSRQAKEAQLRDVLLRKMAGDEEAA
ncbi:MAG: hypothetical protein JSV18_04400 [Candidatus Bathyarchaeota archaeon]|nr:MAG: hypothetical protein JSV18_04400 [Candidatus Bathyarchaeota archaeon]